MVKEFTEVNFKGWVLNVDKVLTKKEYSNINKFSSETCGCENCLKYIANRGQIFPKIILELFELLGIDSYKEIEISYLGDIDLNKQYYTGWFHFIGNFTGMDCKVPTSKDSFTIDFTKINESFEIGFRKARQLSQFTTEKDLVQIEFACKLS